MTTVRNKDQEKRNDLTVNGKDMFVCNPANTYARRSCPILEGDAAIEFLERVEAMKNVPDPSRPSKERLKELKEFYRKFAIDELNNRM